MFLGRTAQEGEGRSWDQRDTSALPTPDNIIVADSREVVRRRRVIEVRLFAVWPTEQVGQRYSEQVVASLSRLVREEDAFNHSTAFFRIFLFFSKRTENK